MSDENGFEVHDKRKAWLEDTDEKTVSSQDENIVEDTARSSTAEDMHAHSSAGHGLQQGELPHKDFISFISSLAATALMHLGEKIAPDQPDMKDLPAARQMIDLIDLLKAKTAGNLDQDESDVMENILYNLRLRFVRESSGNPAE